MTGPRARRAAALLAAASLLVAGCGDEETSSVSHRPDPAGTERTPPRSEEALRRTAAPAYRDWSAATRPRLRRLAAGVARARESGDTAALVDALTGYARAGREARARLVRIEMPLTAWDPAAFLANAIGAAVTAADREAAARRAGRPATTRHELARAIADQAVGDRRVRARLGLPSPG